MILGSHFVSLKGIAVPLFMLEVRNTHIGLKIGNYRLLPDSSRKTDEFKDSILSCVESNGISKHLNGSIGKLARGRKVQGS